MGKLESIERSMWQFATGSSHPQYRQALWRPTRQGVETIALSEKFEGDSNVNNWNRRGWHMVGVIAVRDGALERILQQPNVDPAVAFAMGGSLVVGRLEGEEALGSLGQGRGHGMRIGPGDLQFAIGGVTEAGTFIAPAAEDLHSEGPIPDAIIGDVRTGYADLRFS